MIMQCLQPITLKNPAKIKTNPSLTVPCGKCAACLSRRRDDWSFRLNEELKQSTSANFVTLTYEDEKCPYKSFRKEDIQLFIKRLRKSLEFTKIKYFISSEYGFRTHRPHYHMIIFNIPLDLDVKKVLVDKWQIGRASCRERV